MTECPPSAPFQRANPQSQTKIQTPQSSRFSRPVPFGQSRRFTYLVSQISYRRQKVSPQFRRLSQCVSERCPATARRRAAEQATRSLVKNVKTVALGWHKSNKTWSENHATRLLASLNNHVFSAIGHQPITELKTRHFTILLKGIEEKGLLEVASRTRQARVADEQPHAQAFFQSLDAPRQQRRCRNSIPSLQPIRQLRPVP